MKKKHYIINKKLRLIQWIIKCIYNIRFLEVFNLPDFFRFPIATLALSDATRDRRDVGDMRPQLQ